MTLSPFSSTQRAHYSSQQNGSVSLILRSAPLGSGTGADILTFTLPINPQAVDIQRPSRQTVTQTLGGAYQDHWGEGLIHISLSGSTGWRPRGPQLLDGYESIIALRKLLHEYDRRCGEGTPQNVFLYLLLDLPSGWERFRVSKVSADYSRTKGSPLLYMYDLSFIALEDLSYVEKANVSGTFVITSYPLKPPPITTGPGSTITPSIITPQTGDGGPSSFGTGVGGAGSRGGNLRPKMLDADADGMLVSGTASTASDIAETCLTEDYFYPSDANFCTTLFSLASVWYGARGWSNAQYLWPVIRDGNPSIFSTSATQDAPILTTTDVRDESYKFQPTKIKMPYLDPAPWGGDGRAYANSYLNAAQSRADREFLGLAASVTARTVGYVFTKGLTNIWNSLAEGYNGVSGAVQNFLDDQQRKSETLQPFSQWSPPDGPPALSSMGPA